MRNILGLLSCFLCLCMWAQAATVAGKPGPLLRVMKNNKYGFVNMSGDVVIPLKYYAAEPFSEGLALVGDGDPSGWGVDKVDGFDWDKTKAYYLITGKKLPILSAMSYIDTTGKVVIPPYRFDMCESFKDGMARVYVDGNVGFIDPTGKVVIEPAFDEAGDFYEGLAAVVMGGAIIEEGSKTKRGGKWGFIDKMGTIVVKPRFEQVTHFSGGLAVVRESGKWMVIDSKGDVAFKVSAPAEPYSAGYHDGRPGWVVTDGLLLVKIPTEKIPYLQTVNDVKGYFQFIGKGGAIRGPKYSNAMLFSEGLAAVQESGGKWRFIDTTGKVVIPGPFDKAYSFSDGMAWVGVGEKMDCIDKTGKVVIERPCGRASKDVATLTTVDGKSAWIDSAGEVIWSE